jgi:hypothetical protein
MILLEDDDTLDNEVSTDEEEQEILINDETVEQYMLMENRRRPIDERERIGTQPITFLYKTKVLVRNKLRRFIIKDSDPMLNLVQQGDRLQLEANPFLDREIRRGNFFIVAYSVSDTNSFKSAQCLVEQIIEAKKQNSLSNKKIKKKNSTLTKTTSITELVHTELEEIEQDSGNDEILVLVGCKSEDNGRQVTYRQGVDYALEKSIPFYEVSSFDNNHSMSKIRGVFMTAFETILKAERTKRDDIKNKDKIVVGKSLNIEELLNLPICYID